MIARFHPLLWLGLLLVSCDNPREIADAPKETQAPHMTKSGRPAREESPTSRSRLRETMQKAADIESPKERNQALAEAIWATLELDPELALEGFQKLIGESDEKNQLIQHFAMRLAEKNVEEATKWASALPTEQEQSLAFGNIALVLAEQEPERAAKLLSDSGVAGRDFDVAVVQVVQRWAATSPVQAAEWVMLFEASDARKAGLKSVASVWAQNDPQGAFTWISTIKDSSIREEAAVGMAEAIREQPESRQDELLQLAPPEVKANFEKINAPLPEE